MSIRKEDFIKRYGEEAYLLEKEKRRLSHKKYVEEHREKVREHGHKYRKTHREELRIKDKEKRERKKSYYIEKDHERYIKKREEILTKKKEYYKKNRNQKLQYAKTQVGRANNLLSTYRHSDNEHNREGFNLTSSWIIENIFNSKCVYCEEDDWTKLGCDRIDNTKAHTTDNCVCACFACNLKRKDKYAFEEFMAIKRSELNKAS